MLLYEIIKMIIIDCPGQVARFYLFNILFNLMKWKDNGC